MKKRKILILFFLIFTMLTVSCANRFGTDNSEPEPTAVIIDAETGEPVEGAVALAVWWGSMAIGGVGGGGGGLPVAREVKETVSDSKGRIYIDDFWDWHVFESDYPHLSVYKCGYSCWNRYRKFGGGKRYDFDEKNKIVRLEKWPNNFSALDHLWFINSRITQHGQFGHVGIFFNAWDECENKLRIKERRKK